jgi:hypothetical protein
VRGELWHQIDIDHQVYLAIITSGVDGDLNTRLRRLLHLDAPPQTTGGTWQAPSRTATDVTVRAHGAAPREDPHRITAPALAEQVRAPARALADLLGVELADITVRRDERIAPGDPPMLLLTVSDGARRHEFAVPGWRGDRILAVLPCPLCAEPVATCLIADLAAYGTLLATLPLEAIALDERHRVLDEVAQEFFTDPGHDPTCRYNPQSDQIAHPDTTAP